MFLTFAYVFCFVVLFVTRSRRQNYFKDADSQHINKWKKKTCSFGLNTWDTSHNCVCCSRRTNLSFLSRKSYLKVLFFNKVIHKDPTATVHENTRLSPLCLCSKSLRPLAPAHQAMPFFFFPWPVFLDVRLPFIFLACRWLIHTGY